MDLNTRGIVNYLLLPMAGVFYVLSKIRLSFYRLGVFKINQFSVPVIVVGNITVGGSGKTPVVIKLVEYFQQQGKKVGVVSRGYGGAHTTGSLLVKTSTQAALSGDEPLLIASVTRAPVMVNKIRSKAVQALIEQKQVDLVISDDGLQHYAMGRTVEIAVVDGNRRFGNGFFLPAGPLRESQNRLKEVDFVINNGAAFAGEICAQLKPVKFIHILSGQAFALDFFKDKSCHGVAGIGHPDRFFDALERLNVQVVKHYFADHYAYQVKDLAFEDAHPIIMSAKDWVKCKQFANDKMYYLKVDLDINETFLNELAEKL